LSKLLCICGHVIHDQTDFLPYKGRILKDYDQEAVSAGITRECEALADAVATGDREAWLRRHFLEGYPRELSDSSVFHDFLLGLCVEYLVTVYECEQCGRLWVQKGVSDSQFIPFVPESGRWERVLRSERDERAEQGAAADPPCQSS
jgi:hypothetical protein